MDIRYGEEELEILADEEPGMFLSILNKDNLSVATLSFALEVLGRKFPEQTSLAYFNRFVTHAHPLVREGCALGLSHYEVQVVSAMSLLQNLSFDPVPEVATVAKRALMLIFN